MTGRLKISTADITRSLLAVDIVSLKLFENEENIHKLNLHLLC